MHEMSIAESILEIVKEALKDHSPPPQVQEVRCAVGVLNAVIPESLSFCFEVIRTSWTPLSSAELTIKMIPLKVFCSDCGITREQLEPILICPECSAPAELKEGEGIIVESVEVEES
jgi:hydrogenase nickel incorporation protein HypA/HybF